MECAACRAPSASVCYVAVHLHPPHEPGDEDRFNLCEVCKLTLKGELRCLFNKYRSRVREAAVKSD
jgi:hypothetical protein